MKNMVLIPKVVMPKDNFLITNFGDKIGVEMKSTKDLMNWIIFGDTKQDGYFSEVGNNDNTF